MKTARNNKTRNRDLNQTMIIRSRLMRDSLFRWLYRPYCSTDTIEP